LPSDVQAAPSSAKQSLSVSSQLSAHSPPAAHGFPEPLQLPPLQTSVTVQYNPSSQESVLLTPHDPVALQTSSVQGLSSEVQAAPSSP
jgi:hypothetical protein